MITNVVVPYSPHSCSIRYLKLISGILYAYISECSSCNQGTEEWSKLELRLGDLNPETGTQTS